MVKRLMKIVSALLLLALVIAGIFFYSIFVTVERLTVNYQTIASTKIPASLNDVQIAFIADLEYNHFMDKDRFTKMIAVINEVHPDVVIFGGDIFNMPLTYVPNDATKQEVSQLLKTIDAPLGKFAVLGEQDNVDADVNSMVVDVLRSSDFELLSNTAIRLRNGTKDSVTLIGLDSLVGGSIDLESAFSNVSADQFNILATHCPDTILLEGLPTDRIDLMLTAHSHAAQIRFPLLGALSTDEGAKTYNHGKHTVGHTTLHICNGLGTSTMDMRLFSPPQMLVYRLVHQEASKPADDNKAKQPDQSQMDQSQDQEAAPN